MFSRDLRSAEYYVIWGLLIGGGTVVWVLSPKWWSIPVFCLGAVATSFLRVLFDVAVLLWHEWRERRESFSDADADALWESASDAPDIPIEHHERDAARVVNRRDNDVPAR